MSGLEAAAIGFGSAVARAACAVWLGDHPLAGAAGQNLIEQAAQRLTGLREQRRFTRMWEQAAELVAERLEPVLFTEFRKLPEHERLAAIDAAKSTFDTARLTAADIFAQDLDAGYLDRYVRNQDPGRVRRSGLAEDSAALYRLLVREGSAYTIELARTLPEASMTALTEVLRRERQLLDDMRTVLARLPERRGLVDFGRDYRQLVAGVLDQVEFFGATLAESSRRYPLSVAYLSLTVSGDLSVRRDHDQPVFAEFTHSASTGATTARVEDVLAGSRRLFVRGEAGSGKTTLLQWIAVQSARSAFPPSLKEWNDTVPFFIPLRRHAEGDLPAPERFVTEAGRHIAAQMPDGWVHELLRSGRAVVLIDGVDELTETRRGEARRWLHELVAAFPDARYVVTTRPAAVASGWLGRDEFDVAELEPMSAADVPIFVHRWHEAMRDQSDTDEQRAELTDHEQRLLAAFSSQRHLRSLAKYPLLCALLCALHRDRHGQLPGNRMELYEVALQMLLERRDRERRIDREPSLTRTDKTLLLRDIAYRLIRNGWSSVSSARAQEWVGQKLAGMAQIDASAEEVYRVLLERSGLLREPVEGQTDFVHRTFQEYLAATEAVATHDIGALIANAYTDLWSDVVVMAAGHATPAQRQELIGGLLKRSEEDTDPRFERLASSLRLLAMACLENSPEVPPDLRREVEEAVGALLPPRTMATAQLLAKSGSFTLDLLARAEPRTSAEVAGTIRALADISDPAGLPLLAQFGKDPRKQVTRELLRAWPRFDPDDYARTVLAEHPLDAGTLEIQDRSLLPTLHHLRNLRSLDLHRAGLDPVALDFVAELTQLRRLRVPDLVDLSPLRGSGLEELWQTRLHRLPDKVVTLEPLADVPGLTRLCVAGNRVEGLGVLRDLTGLSTLLLGNIGEAAAIDSLTSLRSLDAFGVGGAAGLSNLEELSFLEAPRQIEIYYCPHLTSIAGLPRWSHTLESVSIIGCPVADLSPLESLPKLSDLDLVETANQELDVVARIPRLRDLMLAIDPLPNLAPLRDAVALEILRLFLVSEIDLSPLAGRKGLKIIVGRRTRVVGAERLGAGSKVVREG